LNIALIQYNIIWENPQRNRQNLDSILLDCKDCDLVILPEMFTTGFSMNTKSIAEPSFGDTFKWMKQKSEELQTVLMGSVSVFENQKYFNRLYVVGPDQTHFYDKKHLFTIAKENQYYSAGKKELVVNIKGWKIKPLICYDLRFPLWSRNKHDKGDYSFDALVYVANWPAVRSNAWVALLQARAIENLAYTIGVNRIGEDANGVKYNGSSRAFDFKGLRQDQMDGNEFYLQKIKWDKTELDKFRGNFPSLDDASGFTLGG